MTDHQPRIGQQPEDRVARFADVESRLRAALAERADPIGLTTATGATATSEAGGLVDLRRRLGPSLLGAGASARGSTPPLTTDLPLARVRPLPPGRGAGPQRHRLVAAVAAAAVLVLLGGALVLRPRGGGEVRTTQPAIRAATGWYVPRDLPPGWQLRSARAQHVTTDLCPCSSRLWSGPDLTDGLRVSVLWRTAQPPARWEDQVTLRADTVGWVQEAEQRIDVTWHDQQGGARLSAVGITRGEAVEQARSLVGVTDPPPPDGLVQDDAWAIDEPITGYTTVTLTYRAPGGAEVLVEVGATGTTGGLHNGFRPQLSDRDADPGVRLVDVGPGPSGVLGRWPGGDVLVSPGSSDAADAPTASNEDVGVLLDALEPATATEWAAYVEAAPPGPLGGAVPKLARAADLLDRPGDPTVEPQNGSSDTTAAVDGSTTTVAASATDDTDDDTTATTAPPGVDDERSAQALLARFEAFGDGRQPTVSALADEVRLGLGPTDDRVVPRGELGSPESWLIETDGYAGRTGPTSAVDLIATLPEGVAVRATAGAVDTCASGRPHAPAFDPDAGQRIVTFEPEDITSCGFDWFAVVLTVDAADRVVAVHTFLVEP